MFNQGLTYIILPIFFYTNHQQSLQQHHLQISQPNISSTKLEKYSKNYSIKLNITKKDLLSVGYNQKRNPWTQQQDKRLLELAKQQKLDWQSISKNIHNRNPKMCYSRYRRLSYDTKKRWTLLQNQKIIQLTQKEGLNWKKISDQIEGRTPRQIQQHYQYCLRPNLNKSEWSLEQDLQLIDLLGEYGTQWHAIEQKMGGRTQNQIKNRYFGRLLKIHREKQKKQNQLYVEQYQHQ